jgi:hypothetical protein
MNETKYKRDSLDENKLYSFIIEVDMLDRLKAEAEMRVISVGQLIREAIELWFRVNT